MIFVDILYIIIVQVIYKRELDPVLFIFVTALIGALIMSLIGEILYTVLFKLITLFAATFQYTLDKIS